MKKKYIRNGFEKFEFFHGKMFLLLSFMTMLLSSKAEAQYTLIPDPNFEQALINFGHDDVLDGHVLTSNISSITNLSIFTNSISSLQGIEDFASLTHLDVHNNFLTEINVSSLTNLVYLDCSYNQIDSISLNGLQHLSYFDCSISGLSNLSLTNLPSLSILYCSNNQLTQLNLSGLTSLVIVDCTANQINSLNVNGLINLETLHCSVNALSSLDVSTLIGLSVLSCNINQLTTLDVSGLPNFDHLFCFSNQLTSLDIRNCPTLNVLYCHANPDLTCILVDDVEVAVTTIAGFKDSFTQYSTDCNFNSGPTKVIPSQCGATLTKLNDNVYANFVSDAQAYRFKITDLTSNSVQIIDRPLRVFQFTTIANYAYGKTYKVEVAPKINNAWLAYGLPCEVTTPSVTTQLQSLSCGATVTDFNQPLSANIVPYALGYRFKIINNDTGQVTLVDRPIRSFMMSVVSDVQYNQSFSIAVAVKNTNGVYMSYGPTCQIYTTALSKTQNNQKENFKTIAYPNPFAETTKLHTLSSNNEISTLYIYDISGKLIENITITDGNLESVAIGSDYKSGIYYVKICANNECKILRIVKL